MTSTPIKSQIVMMPSTEIAFSSDEFETLSVSTDNYINPLMNLKVDNIEIEIVEDLNDNELPTRFWPLGDEDRKIATLKFSLVINSQTHPLRHSGFGQITSKPPPISIKARSDGACLFNTFSILLSGHDTYSAIIQNVICNYIANPVKFSLLQTYKPLSYKTGNDYIAAKNMRNFSTWGTKVELIAFAQILGFDVIVYTQHQQFVTYKHDSTSHSECKFFISNESGYNFDPILDAEA